MSNSLEKTFDAEMRNIFDEASKLGYRPMYFLRMVQQLGGLEAARRLIDSPTPAEGFTRLFELGRIDLSVEAIASQERFRTLFTDEQLRRAADRLKEVNYEVGDGTND